MPQCLSSVEYRWLARRNRGLHLPTFLVDDGLLEEAGFYCPPFDGLLDLGGSLFAADAGVIVISGCQFFPSTLAHEWRHHQQWCHGFRFPERLPLEFDDDYEADIRTFFRQPHEYDALSFEVRSYPDEGNEMWWDLIHGSDSQI